MPLMEDRIAKVVSYIFHPILIPLYSLIIIFQLNIFQIYCIPPALKWLITGMVAIGTIVLPVTLMLLFVRRGHISSIRMEQREERSYPYIVMTVLFCTMYVLIGNYKQLSIISDYLLGVTLLIFLALIINLRWKISIHMIGMGGLTGLLIALAIQYVINLQIVICISIILAGIVGYARLKLEAHRPPEIYFGFLLGVAVMLISYMLL
jgi:hypothetical protein